MQALGRHALAEFGGCDAQIIANPETLTQALVEAAQCAKATIVEVISSSYGEEGFLGMVIISESHLSAYAKPEKGSVVIDVFTCGDAVNPLVAISYLQEKLGAKYFTIKQILRGDTQEIMQYSSKDRQYQVA
jgi:S-adenosylmethionine decarboxylase